MSRKSLILSLAAVAVLSLSALAVAGQGFGPGGCGMGPMQALTPEQREQAMVLFEEHQKAMIPLREQIRAKHALLEAALRAEKPDTKAVDGLTKELGELKVRVLTEQVALSKKLAAAGLPAAFGPGLGHMGMGGPGKGMMGHGKGMGPGMGGCPGMGAGPGMAPGGGCCPGMGQAPAPGPDMMGMDQEPGPDMLGMGFGLDLGLDADMDEAVGYGG